MSSDRAVHLARLALLVTAWAFVGCLIVQLFLVGLDVFEVTADDAIHREFAYIYGWLAPGLVLMAAAGQVPRRQLWTSVALLVLFALQTYLPLLADRFPLLAAFHAVNALAVVWLAVHLASGARRLVGPFPSHGDG